MQTRQSELEQNTTANTHQRITLLPSYKVVKEQQQTPVMTPPSGVHSLLFGRIVERELDHDFEPSEDPRDNQVDLSNMVRYLLGF